MPDLIQRLQAVARCGLDPTERLMLLVLAQYTDEESAITLASWDTLRAATGLARSTVAEVLDALRRGGTLERLSTPGHSTRYRVAWGAPETWRSERAPRRRGDPSATRTRPAAPSATRTRPAAPRVTPRREVSFVPEFFDDEPAEAGCPHCGHHSPSASRTTEAEWVLVPAQSQDPSASRTRPPAPSATRTPRGVDVRVAQEETSFSSHPSATRTRPAEQTHLFTNPSLPPTGGSLPTRFEVPAPHWTPTDCSPWTQAEMITMVCRAILAVRGVRVQPRAAGPDAKLVLALWRDLGKPEPEAFAGDVALLAAWAQRSHEDAALNDIRGIDRRGDRWTADRSRNVRTLTNAERWGDRLELARQWDARGRQDVEAPGGDSAAWEQVLDAIREHGGRNAGVRHLLTDRQAQALATLGGVFSIAAAPISMWPSLRANFLRACAELGRRAASREAA